MQIKLNFNSRDRVNRRHASHPVPEPVGRPRSRRAAAPGSDTRRSDPEAARRTGWSRVEEVFQELDQLVGLREVKETLREIAAYVQIQKQRQQEGLFSDPMTLHMVFKGGPGTGKTTVARLAGKLFKELGVLSKGHLVEVDRADLVGEYIGHTAQKTKEQLKRAAGGILFVDEAYSLARGGDRDFGKEATDMLVKYMEDWREDLIVILAGYTHEMEVFMSSNPGLKSRFPLQIEFPDYTIMELLAIARLMLDQRQYLLEEEAWDELERSLRRAILQGQAKAGNGRLVRNMIEKAIRRQAVRLVNQPRLTREELMMIRKSDLAGENHSEVEIPEKKHVSTIARKAAE
ncbi:MAG TPA: AAA family ATPase [Clostridia bacterium]|nr:AAA family ATPase [Clostridia bacterium]